jgi:hypothetical protein
MVPKCIVACLQWPHVPNLGFRMLKIPKNIIITASMMCFERHCKRRRYHFARYRDILDIPELFSHVCSFILFDESTFRRWQQVSQDFVHKHVNIEHVMICNWRWVERCPVQLPNTAKHLWIYLKSPAPSIENVNDDMNELLCWFKSRYDPLEQVNIISEIEAVSLYVAVSLTYSRSVHVTLKHIVKESNEERSFHTRSLLSSDLRELNGKPVVFDKDDIKVQQGIFSAKRKLDSGVTISITREYVSDNDVINRYKVNNNEINV